MAGESAEVEAAGGVVWRTAAGGAVEVLVVHRPKYDDWSLPKGKLEPGETHQEAAAREVREETGLVCALGDELPSTSYLDRKGRPKRVRYWAMTVTGGEPTLNDEVDEMRWLAPATVDELLTYTRDVTIVRAFARGLAAPPAGPLADLRVVDCSTVVAGPACARYLADFGADVIKVERPDGGDTTRSLGWRDPRDGETLWWKLEGRGKRTIALDLKTPEGRRTMERLCDSADVLIENFRPGTLERLGLAPDRLIERNPKLVVVRITGFGQDGPYAGRPGFATLAEAMSGFAAINGEPGGDPLLPPIALTDEVAGLAAALAAMVAVHSGRGQVVDVSLLESLFQLMGPLPAAWSLLGYVQPRLGSGIPYSVPRGTYRTADGQWVAISSSAPSVARRFLALIGLGDDRRLDSFEGRVEHRELVDGRVREWVAARPLSEVMAACEEVHAAAAPVMDMAAIAEDPHYRARQSIVDVDGVAMQGLIARLSATPGAIRWAGRPLGADTAAVLAELEELEGTDRPVPPTGDGQPSAPDG